MGVKEDGVDREISVVAANRLQGSPDFNRVTQNYADTLAPYLTAEQFANDSSTVDELIRSVKEFAAAVKKGEVAKPSWENFSGISVDINRLAQLLETLDQGVIGQDEIAIKRVINDVPPSFFARIFVLRIHDAADRGDKDKEYARRYLLLKTHPSFYEYTVLAFPEIFLADQSAEGGSIAKCQQLREILDRISKQMMEIGISDELPVFREGSSAGQDPVFARTLVNQLDVLIGQLQKGKKLKPTLKNMKSTRQVSGLLVKPLEYIAQFEKTVAQLAAQKIRQVINS